MFFALAFLLSFGQSTQVFANSSNPSPSVVAPQSDAAKLICKHTWQLDEATYILLYQEYLENNPNPDNPTLDAVKQVLSVVCMTKFNFSANGQVVMTSFNGGQERASWTISPDGAHLIIKTGNETHTYEFEVDDEHFILHDIETNEADDVMKQFIVLKSV